MNHYSKDRSKTRSCCFTIYTKGSGSQWTQFWTIWFNMEENEVLQLEPPSHAKWKKMYMVFQQLFTVHNRLPLVGTQGLFYIISVELWVTTEIGLMNNRQKFGRSKWKSDFWKHLTTFITDMKVIFDVTALCSSGGPQCFVSHASKMTSQFSQIGSS